MKSSDRPLFWWFWGLVAATAAMAVFSPAHSADSYTGNLRIVQQIPGTNASTWGTKANSAFAMLDEAISKVTNISVTGGNVTLSVANNSSDQARSAVLVITGTPGTPRNVVAPNVQKPFYIYNNSDSTIVFSAGSGSTVSIASLAKATVFTDGATNVVPLSNVSSFMSSVLVAQDAATVRSTLGVGTVNSVAMTVPSFLSVSGSPLTSSGTLAISLSGIALPLVNGGTGATTALTARNNFGLGTQDSAFFNKVFTALDNVGGNMTGLGIGYAGTNIPFLSWNSADGNVRAAAFLNGYSTGDERLSFYAGPLGNPSAALERFAIRLDGALQVAPAIYPVGTMVVNGSGIMGTANAAIERGNIALSSTDDVAFHGVTTRLSVGDATGITIANTVSDTSHITFIGGTGTTRYNLQMTDFGFNLGFYSGTPALGTLTMKLTNTGTVTMPQYGAGTMEIDSSGNVITTSDERLKAIDGQFERGLDAVEALVPISYHWNKLSGNDTINQYAGFSAQNVLAAIPEAVGENKQGYLTLSERPLLAALVNAVKELEAENGALRARVSRLETVH